MDWRRNELTTLLTFTSASSRSSSASSADALAPVSAGGVSWRRVPASGWRWAWRSGVGGVRTDADGAEGDHGAVDLIGDAVDLLDVIRVRDDLVIGDDVLGAAGGVSAAVAVVAADETGGHCAQRACSIVALWAESRAHLEDNHVGGLSVLSGKMRRDRDGLDKAAQEEVALGTWEKIERGQREAEEGYSMGVGGAAFKGQGGGFVNGLCARRSGPTWQAKLAAHSSSVALRTIETNSSLAGISPSFKAPMVCLSSSENIGHQTTTLS